MLNQDDTIVAIATPLGEGGLGVIRLSGPQAFSIADKIFRAKTKLSAAESHTLHHGWIQKIDEVVAAVFQGPHSYTGEDVVEFSCHGSPTVLKDVVRVSIDAGARPAQPGEFTERAYLNGKLDLPQAEAVADLIHAHSEKARAAAVDQLRGQLSIRINGFREDAIKLLAHIEANLDFSEEEIPIIAREKITKSLDKIIVQMDQLLSTSVKGRWLKEGLRVTLAGRPNVGKSSLFNALLAQDRAIVTDMPGTTRDTLEERLDWDGYPIVLIDTAGLRATTDAVEAHGTARANKAHANADVILLVLDASVGLTADDQKILHDLDGKNVVAVLNKIDLPVKLTKEELTLKTAAVSAKTNTGLSDLQQAVVSSVITKAPESESATVITNLRHVHHLEQSRDRLKAARAATERKKPEESIALDVRAALEELGKITGESVTEDVLSEIFRQFCIGK